ncbi:MAG: SAM-dependent methyltransferase [Candidatus Heimdallarchaeota archaeon]|nr:SAM-dependent methyltransferase [Candidatus Heimdallarchaeota archaeon]
MKTSTKSFGSSKKETHDSSYFYDSKLFDTHKIVQQKSIIQNEISKEVLNKVHNKDSTNIDFIPDDSIHLIITSPPYNNSKEYDEDLSLEEYLKLINDVMVEAHRILIRGGRICINIANIGRKPYIPLSTYIDQIMIKIGFLPRGQIIWDKSASAGPSTAWGSWQSASNPILRDIHEYILVYSKGEFGRKNSRSNKDDSISKDAFLENTKSIWKFPTASARKVGHPAPFPIELPKRLIELYSFENDIILDPFAGSGTTAIAAKTTNRNYIMIDINSDYCKLATERINKL